MPHKFLSSRDERDRAQLEAFARPINSHDLLRMELRIEFLLFALFQQLERQLKMTRDEALSAIAGLKLTVQGIGDEVTKVGTETDTLIQKVADLTAQINAGGDVAPEIAAALADVQTSANSVKAGIQAVDDKVPDDTGATTTTSTTPNPTP